MERTRFRLMAVLSLVAAMLVASSLVRLAEPQTFAVRGLQLMGVITVAVFWMRARRLAGAAGGWRALAGYLRDPGARPAPITRRDLRLCFHRLIVMAMAAQMLLQIDLFFELMANHLGTGHPATLYIEQFFLLNEGAIHE